MKTLPLIVIAVCAMISNVVVVAKAETITVFNQGDSGAGTLRQAIFDASAGDTINFAEGISYISVGQELLIGKNLTINGPGADKLKLQSGCCARIFHIPASITATISGLTITRGFAGLTGNGGGVLNAGTLTINNCTITENETSSSGNGGGIANEGTLTINNSTVSGNIAFGSTSRGSGIANTGALLISNSTISDNRARVGDSPDGVGVANYGGGTVTIVNTTIAGNGHSSSASCGGGVFTEVGSNTAIRGTIIAVNQGTNGPDICGPVTSQGFNLIGNNASGSIASPQPSDFIGTTSSPIDPLLGPLQYNGGPTFTRALQSTSLAVNNGDPNGPARDQRGYLRAGITDIGAFEFAGTVPVSLANISTRLLTETGNNVLIGGFIITGAQPKKVIVRAIGPSLPIAGVLGDPILELRTSGGTLIDVNDNWRGDHEAEIIATTIPPSDDRESAIVATLPANNSAYTAVVRGVNNSIGIGVVEVYDLNRTVESKLGNISTRGFVQTGDNVLIGGLIIVGEDPQKLIVRGIGPSLNITGKLANPTLELRDANGGLIRSNDNWRSNQEAELIATTIPPTNDLESAIVETLSPANYTAILRGAGGSTGIAVVEVYGL